MSNYRYDIFFFEKDEAGNEKQVYLFNGPHSFQLTPGSEPFFNAEVEHLQPVDGDDKRVRLKFEISRR